MTGNDPVAAGRGLSPGPPARRLPAARPPRPSRAVFLRRRLVVLTAAGLLVLAIVTVVRLAGSGGASVGVTWHLSPASNTVTIRLTRGDSQASRAIQAGRHLLVAEEANGRPGAWSRYGPTARVAVRPGAQTRLLVQVKGAQPFSRVLSVTAPAPLRVIRTRPRCLAPVT